MFPATEAIHRIQRHECTRAPARSATPARAYDRIAMSAALLLTLLIAGLVALLPVWRLRLAGWPARWLLTAWLVYGAWILVSIRFPGPVRFLIPLLVLAFVAPFVAGPERLSRIANARRDVSVGTVINVTPRAPTGLPEPKRRVEGAVVDAPEHDAQGDEADVERGEPPPSDREPRA